MARRCAAGAILVLRFLAATLTSGFATLRLVLARGPRPASGFMRLRIGPLSERGAAWLGALVTLTPGSTTISVDPRTREMVLHLLDASDPAGVEAAIRRDFEAPLLVLAGRKASA
jgi:multisubunit Na+/H+ antiporter MnhE subunit